MCTVCYYVRYVLSNSNQSCELYFLTVFFRTYNSVFTCNLAQRGSRCDVGFFYKALLFQDWLLVVLLIKAHRFYRTLLAFACRVKLIVISACFCRFVLSMSSAAADWTHIATSTTVLLSIQGNMVAKLEIFEGLYFVKVSICMKKFLSTVTS